MTRVKLSAAAGSVSGLSMARRVKARRFKMLGSRLAQIMQLRSGPKVMRFILQANGGARREAERPRWIDCSRKSTATVSEARKFDRTCAVASSML